MDIRFDIDGVVANIIPKLKEAAVTLGYQKQFDHSRYDLGTPPGFLLLITNHLISNGLIAKVPFYKEAAETVARLRMNGHQIIYLTARSAATDRPDLAKLIERDTLKWLNAHNLMTK